MRPILGQTTLVEQVYDEILKEITDGRLKSNARLIQDELARSLGVSRQPVQQALLLLHSQGYLQEAAGSGLVVAPIDLRRASELYEIRCVVEGMAARLAAGRRDKAAADRAAALIDQGRKAARQGVISKLLRADMDFHKTIYDMSGNQMIRETLKPAWHQVGRVMGEVLAEETPGEIWDQHDAILSAILSGDADAAERHAQQHVSTVAAMFIERLRLMQGATEAPVV